MKHKYCIKLLLQNLKFTAKVFALSVLLGMSLWGCSKKQTLIKQDYTELMSSDETDSRVEQAGEKVVIALLDTGVSEKAIESGCLLAGYNYVTDSNDTQDKVNHGTAVASVILGSESAGVLGIAKDAYLVPLVIVTEENGEMRSASPEIFARAIIDSIDVYHADIINISLGIYKDDDALHAAVEYAEEQGVLVVAAVGNGGAEGKPYYPAAYDTVLAVGACDRDGNVSEFTQTGADVLAQGEDIWLASKNGKTYGAKGTSYATGFVSAEAANLLKEEPYLTPKELRKTIVQKAK